MALNQARSGIARANNFRSNFYTSRLVVAVNGTERSGTGDIQLESVRISLRLNDEPDRASFRLKPGAAFTPTVGQAVIISLGSVENRLFAGQIVKVRRTQRISRNVSPFVTVDCLDWSGLFNRARITAAYVGRTATDIGRDLVDTYTFGFTSFHVETGLPTVDYFPLTNEKPLEALRRLANLIGGWCYVDAFRDVHLWTGAEPSLTNPTTLIDDLWSLKAFESDVDGSQLRNRVICEGKRTTCPIPIIVEDFPSLLYGKFEIPVNSPDPFPISPTTGLARLGTQRFQHGGVDSPYQYAVNNSTVVSTDAAVGATELEVDGFAGASTWCRVQDQYIYFGDTDTVPTRLKLIPASGLGSITGPIAAGSQVTYLPVLIQIDANAFTQDQAVDSDVVMYAQVDDTTEQAALQTIEGSDGSGGVHEFVISDGRLSTEGATAVAQADLDAFSDADGLLQARWETDDLNAVPGAQQVINLTSPDTLSATLTITAVDLRFFPVPHAVPRRECVAGTVKPAVALDVTSRDN